MSHWCHLTASVCQCIKVKPFHIFGQEQWFFRWFFHTHPALEEVFSCCQATKKEVMFLTNSLSGPRYEHHLTINTTNVLFLGKYQHRNQMSLHTSCNCSIPKRKVLWQQIVKEEIYYILILELLTNQQIKAISTSSCLIKRKEKLSYKAYHLSFLYKVIFLFYLISFFMFCFF